MENQQPLVSVICPTYNHEKYITEALEGFVKQNTSFPFEIIVHDDASTDNTAKIVREYESKFPHLFRNVYQAENQFSKSIGYITRLTFSLAKGKYIAICEGDDYWIDPLKLQKQVDFLETNPDFAICFHSVYERVNKGRLRKSQLNKETEAHTYTIEDLSHGNFIHTLSVVFRNNLFDELPLQFMESPALDYVIHLLNAKKGKIRYLPDRMAVYRRQNQGLYSLLSNEEQHKKMARVLSLLISYQFPTQVLQNLHAQYFKLREDYLLLLLMNEKFELFNTEAEAFFREHPERTGDWISHRVPAFFKVVSQSKTYIFSKKLSAIAHKFKLTS